MTFSAISFFIGSMFGMFIMCVLVSSKDDDKAPQVKHGQWVEIDNKVVEHGFVERKGKTWMCTNCGEARKTRTNPDMNYCSNCGAKMDGVNNGNQVK